MNQDDIRLSGPAASVRLKGVSFFAALIILQAVAHLLLILDWEQYKFMFQFLPSRLIPVRYALSVASRVLLIICAVGVYRYHNPFRKLLIVLCLLNIVCLYWKHPYQAFLFLDQYHHVRPEFTDRMLAGVFGADFPSYALIKRLTLAAVIVGELVNFLVMIIYFRHPKVRERFEQPRCAPAAADTAGDA